MSAAPAAQAEPPPAAAAMRIRAIGEESAGAWDRYVSAAPGASFYHRYAWRSLIARVFARESHYLAADDGARITGVLPLVRLKSRLFGDFLVSMPYLNYGGVLADSDEIGAALVAEASALAGRLGVSHVELRHTANHFGELPVRTDKVTMLRDLPASAEELWKTIGKKVRWEVNQARKADAACVTGGAELLDDFYAVFAENMRDLGTPVYPRRFFAAILEAFPNDATLLIVRIGSAPTAAGLLLDDGFAVQIPWASSLRRWNGQMVNMLLYWSALEFACGRGRRVFDFGRSTLDSGTYRFKRKWGAEAKTLYWHYWMRGGGAPPQLNPQNAKFALAIALWRRLPLAIANRLGPLLVANLP